MFKFLKEKLQGWTKKFTKGESEKKQDADGSFDKKEEKQKTSALKAKKIVVREETKIIEEKGFFQKIKEKLSSVTISDSDFETYAEELKMLLLENNVAFEVSEKIVSDLKEKIVGQKMLKKEIESQIKISLGDSISDALIEPFDILEKIKEKSYNFPKEPFVITFVGINGTGKTTTIAKIASWLSKNDISCVLAAGDTFRAASIEQIKTHGSNLGIKVVSQQYGSDPAAVGFDAIQYARRNSIKCVLIDTAGRMHTQKNLLKEIEKISRVCKPDLKIFVGESITGNDAVEQAKTFNESINIDGIVLTKSDVDEKGGTALSVGFATKKPILFLGTGQEYNKIEVFSKQKFLEKLGL